MSAGVSFFTSSAMRAAFMSGPDGIFTGLSGPPMLTLMFVPPTSMTRTFIAVCSNLPLR